MIHDDTQSKWFKDVLKKNNSFKLFVIFYK